MSCNFNPRSSQWNLVTFRAEHKINSSRSDSNFSTSQKTSDFWTKSLSFTKQESIWQRQIDNRSSDPERQQLKLDLEEWCVKDTSPWEYETRRLAAKRILNCYEMQSKILKLNKLYLSSLPDAIGKLKSLQVLDLSQNELSSLPESLGNLVQLHTLLLEVNQLTTLPSSFQNLKLLSKLDGSGNQFSSIPEPLLVLSNLHSLHFESNPICSLSDLTKLTHLNTLNLSECALSSLPDSIGNLPNLQWLYLRNNRLSSLPATLQHLQDLILLDVSKNRISELPDILSEFQHLTTLNLSCNSLCSIPELPSSLNELNLSHNRIFSIPVQLFSLPHQCNVDLSDCPISAMATQLIQQRLQERSYEGPAIQVQQYPYDLRISLEQIIDDLYLFVCKTKPPLNNLLHGPGRAILQIFLHSLHSCLCQLDDLGQKNVQLVALVLLVVGYLQRAERDESFRSTLLSAMETLNLNQIEDPIFFLISLQNHVPCKKHHRTHRLASNLGAVRL